MDAMIPSAFEPSTPLLESFRCPGPPRRCTTSGIGSVVRMKSDENESLTLHDGRRVRRKGRRMKRMGEKRKGEE